MFHHIHSVEIGSTFVFCHSQLLLSLNVKFGFAEFLNCVITCGYKKSLHNTIKYEILRGMKACSRSTAIREQISYQKWFYKTIYALIFLKIPDQMHHLTHAELV